MKHQLAITWQHIRRSPYQALAAVMVMMVTSLIALSILLSVMASHRLLGYLQQRPQVIAFFNDTITSVDQVKDVVGKINSVAVPAKVEFVSKEKAFEIYKQRNQNDPLLSELVSPNILPASLEVSAKSVADLPKFYEVLNNDFKSIVEEVTYQKDVVENLINVMEKIYRGGAIVLIFLTVTALLTVLTIVGMKIALRKEEISVEKLVGASNWYVRFPFLFEGFFYGAVGAALAWAVIMGVILLISPGLMPYFAGVGILPIQPLFAIEVLIGAVAISGSIGVVGSFLAVWRYLR